jgi:Flp pilus assembly protein TadG
MRSMTRHFPRSRRIRQRRGAVAVMIAIMIPVLLAVAGLAIDLGAWYREANRLQLAADAGAMGAARLLAAQTASTSDFQKAALLEAQGITAGNWIGALATPVAIGVAPDWSKVTVTLTSTADLYFARVLGVSAPTLHATATAGTVTSQNACILTLSATASIGIDVENMGSVTASGCGIFANATATAAVYLNSGTIKGTSLGAAGGIDISNSGSNLLSALENAFAGPQTDPYANSLQTPTPGACSYTNASFTAYQATAYQFTQANNVFCGNTTIGGNATTDTFAPGVYYVVNGNLTFNNATVTSAAGVTFVLTGSNPGAFSWTNYSNTTTTMTAPTTGATAGILVWQTCPASGSAAASTFAGGSTLQISGEIYTPCGALNLSNNVKLTSVAGSTVGFGVEASTLSVQGSASLSVGAGSSSSSAAQIALLQ